MTDRKERARVLAADAAIAASDKIDRLLDKLDDCGTSISKALTEELRGAIAAERLAREMTMILNGTED